MIKAIKVGKFFEVSSGLTYLIIELIVNFFHNKKLDRFRVSVILESVGTYSN